MEELIRMQKTLGLEEITHRTNEIEDLVPIIRILQEIIPEKHSSSPANLQRFEPKFHYLCEYVLISLILQHKLSQIEGEETCKDPLFFQFLRHNFRVLDCLIQSLNEVVYCEEKKELSVDRLQPESVIKVFHRIQIGELTTEYLESLSPQIIEPLLPVILVEIETNKDKYSSVKELIEKIANNYRPLLFKLAFYQHAQFCSQFEMLSHLNQQEKFTLEELTKVESTPEFVLTGDMCHPLFPLVSVSQAKVNKVFQTAAKPSLITLNCVKEERKVILKKADNVVQDLLCQNMFMLFNSIWRLHGQMFEGAVPFVKTYGIIPFKNGGFIEFVDNCESLMNTQWNSKFDSVQTRVLMQTSIGSFVAGFILVSFLLKIFFQTLISFHFQGSKRQTQRQHVIFK